MSGPPRRLSVLYDDRCGLCRRAVRWLVMQPAHLEIELLPMHDARTRERFPGVAGRLGADEFVVVDDGGGVYADAEARILCLWALRKWRPLAVRMARPSWRPHVRRIFGLVARNRYRLSRFLPGGAVAVPENNRRGACGAVPEDTAS